MCYEIWKDIKGYEGLYQVSNKGRVKRLQRTVETRNRNGFMKRTINEQIIEGFYNKKGYVRVGLCKNGKVKTFVVHRLVAQAFIPNPENYPQVNHIDGIKNHNYLENLEWCTQSYNIQHSYNIGLRDNVDEVLKNNRKKQSKRVAKYDIYGNLVEVYESISDAQRKNNIGRSQILRSCLHQNKPIYRWEFLDS